jgi:putative flippase GtrA
MQIKRINHNYSKEKKLIRFLSVGGTCAIYNLISLYSLTSVLKLHYLFSFILVFLTGNLIGFYLNKYYTFKTQKNLFWKELLKYYTVMTSNFILGITLMFIMVNLLKIWYIYSMVLLTIGGTAYNYWLHNKWSFKKRKN